GFGVERDHAFGAELAERNLQPGAVRAELDEAVEFEVEQFTNAHPGGAQQDDRGASEVVIQTRDRGHQVTVDVGWQSAWKRFGEAWQVVQEEQPPGWLAGPAPRGDVFEEHT